MAALALLPAGCSRGTGGPLETPDVQLSSESDNDREAAIQAGAVSARVSAHWSETGGQSAMLVYTNHGGAAIRIELGGLAMAGPAGAAVAMSAGDVTSTNLLDARTDNDDAVELARATHPLGESVSAGNRPRQDVTPLPSA